MYLTAEWIRLHGRQEPYAQRTVNRAKETTRQLLVKAGQDASRKLQPRDLVAVMESHKRYLMRCETLDHATDEFRVLCARCRRDHDDLIRVSAGGWSDRMFPMLE